MSLLTIVPAILLLLPLVHGELKNRGAVLNFGVSLVDAGAPVHTWYQKDPHNKQGGIYKLDAYISKRFKDEFIVKVFHDESLLEVLRVSRFDDDLLTSIEVIENDKHGRFRIRYKMARGFGISCRVRSYEETFKPGLYVPFEKDCPYTGWFANYWTSEAPPLVVPWHWDRNGLIRKPTKRIGVVALLGMHKHKDQGDLLHVWQHQIEGYKMAVRRVEIGESVSYLAVMSYKDAVLDVVEVYSLGKGLTSSITVIGMSGGQHVIEYAKADRKCQRLQYAGSQNDQSNDVPYQPVVSKCGTLFFRNLKKALRKLLRTHVPGNGWLW